MAKQPSARKREIGLAASDIELDAALLLMELWHGVHHNGSAASSSGGGVKRKEGERDDVDHSSNAETPTTTLAKGIFDDVDDGDEDENDFHLRPRKRRFRSIVDIYRSTKLLDKYNAEKEHKVVTRKCS